MVVPGNRPSRLQILAVLAVGRRDRYERPSAKTVGRRVLGRARVGWEADVRCGDALRIIQRHRGAALGQRRLFDLGANGLNIRLAFTHDRERGQALSEDESIAAWAEAVEHLIH